MVTLNISNDDAFQYVQNRRFCISPNLNFQRQIEAYESIHQASMSMMAYAQQQDGPPVNGSSAQSGRRKRADSDADENGSYSTTTAEAEDYGRSQHAQRFKASPHHDDESGFQDESSTRVLYADV